MTKVTVQNTESDQIDQLKKELAHLKQQLAERNKEVNCHNQISCWMLDDSLTLDEFIKKVVDLLPVSYQYPERTSACIKIFDKSYKSNDFAESLNSQRENIVSGGLPIGQINVYIKQINKKDAVDFLAEEFNLLKTVSVNLGKFFFLNSRKQKLEQNFSKFNSLINNLNEAIIETDKQGMINFISPTISQILGYEPNELLNISLENLITKEEKPAENLVNNNHIGSLRIIQINSKSGSPKWLTYSFQKVLNKNKLIGYTGVLSDISKQKEIFHQLEISELRYKSIFFNSPDAYLIIENGTFIEANSVALEMIGYNRKEFIGKKPYNISPQYQPNGKKSIDYEKTLIEEVIKKGEKSFIWQHKKKTGIYFWLKCI